MLRPDNIMQISTTCYQTGAPTSTKQWQEMECCLVWFHMALQILSNLPNHPYQPVNNSECLTQTLHWQYPQTSNHITIVGVSAATAVVNVFLSSLVYVCQSKNEVLETRHLC